MSEDESIESLLEKLDRKLKDAKNPNSSDQLPPWLSPYTTRQLQINVKDALENRCKMNGAEEPKPGIQAVHPYDGMVYDPVTGKWMSYETWYYYEYGSPMWWIGIVMIMLVLMFIYAVATGSCG